MFVPAPAKLPTGKSTLWTDSVVEQNFQRDLGAIQGKFVWTNGPLCLVLRRFVWTDGAESSSKVYTETGIGPRMALPSPKPPRDRNSHFSSWITIRCKNLAWRDPVSRDTSGSLNAANIWTRISTRACPILNHMFFAHLRAEEPSWIKRESVDVCSNFKAQDMGISFKAWVAWRRVRRNISQKRGFYVQALAAPAS